MKNNKTLSTKFYLSALGLVCSLGKSKQEIFTNLKNGKTFFTNLPNWLASKASYTKQTLQEAEAYPLAQVNIKTEDLPEIPKEFIEHNTRCNRLLLEAYQQIKTDVEKAIQKYGHDQIAVILGTSTSGIDEGQDSVEYYLQNNKYPQNFDYKMLEMASPAELLANYIGLKNMNYSISTACSSSGKVFVSAQNLLKAGLCKAVIVGGCDSLSKLTIFGFASLEAISHEICNPFSKNRSGINIGEGAALFLMTTENPDRESQAKNTYIEFLGAGESSDAHHTTAPHPEGRGASAAMEQALANSQLKPEEIVYLNLHGTATQANDAMESKAIQTVFGNTLPFCSSTKGLTGHTLGAAACIELALCYLTLENSQHELTLPPHLWDEGVDFEIEKVLPQSRFVKPNSNNNEFNKQERLCLMSNSFAFGGSNVSLIISRNQINPAGTPSQSGKAKL